MFDYIIRCDRCGIELKEVWLQCNCKLGAESHLCKNCTDEFYEWLKKGVKE